MTTSLVGRVLVLAVRGVPARGLVPSTSPMTIPLVGRVLVPAAGVLFRIADWFAVFVGAEWALAGPLLVATVGVSVGVAGGGAHRAGGVPRYT